MEASVNSIRQGDCVLLLADLAPGSVDLVFADPPFNIGYTYDIYRDDLEETQYVHWSREWIRLVARALKPNGTFWLAIGDEFAAELKLEAQRIGFHCRSWVVWYYTFGVNCARKFTRSHVHLFHFVKDPDDFTFRDEDLDNRIPSARELVYQDKRANPRGRLPDDTWIIRPANTVGELVCDEDGTWVPVPPRDPDRTFALRPQDLDACFTPSEDTWYFPRVAGTFKERAGFHGCQMPEQLLARIVRTCSEPGDLILDPFAGSATTLAVAKKLGRRFLGFELSEDYVRYGRERLQSIRVGDRLDGSPEPLKSAPRTGQRTGRRRSSQGEPAGGAATEARYAQAQLELTLRGIVDAYRLTYDGFSADRLVADPERNQHFVDACRRLGLAGDARTWNIMLFRLRKTGQLLHLPTTQRTRLAWSACEESLWASEIAWQCLLNEGAATSIDEILCDPKLATHFDDLAAGLAPGHSSFQYRWSALMLRKETQRAKNRARLLMSPGRILRQVQSAPSIPLEQLSCEWLPEEPGLFLLLDERGGKVYAGESTVLRQRFRGCTTQRRAWQQITGAREVQVLPFNHTPAGRLAWQARLAQRWRPRLNYFELCVSPEQPIAKVP